MTVDVDKLQEFLGRFAPGGPVHRQAVIDIVRPHGLRQGQRRTTPPLTSSQVPVT